MARPSTGTRRSQRCPRCGGAVVWQGNPNRPFCSLSCRLIDLGVWLDERYRIAGEPLPAELPDKPTVEDMMPRGTG